MRQLNKDGQKQVNYVICIPPMCTEKGVRLQHKFIVNKEDEEGTVATYIKQSSAQTSKFQYFEILQYLFLHRIDSLIGITSRTDFSGLPNFRAPLMGMTLKVRPEI